MSGPENNNAPQGGFALKGTVNVADTVYSSTPQDHGKVLVTRPTAGRVLNLPPLSQVQDGWTVTVRNLAAAANATTVTPAAADPIDDGVAGTGVALAQNAFGIFVAQKQGAVSTWVRVSG